MNSDFHILCRVSPRGEIIFSNHEWSDSALDNADSEIFSDKILRRRFRDFINDEKTAHSYLMILRFARAGYFTKFRLRCDFTQFQRFLEMRVSSTENGDVQFDTQTINRAKSLQTKNFQRRNTKHMDEVIIICSWCDKIKIGQDEWQEIQESIKSIGLFDFEIVPPPSHGMCDTCYERVSGEFLK
jgi:hypothetical protein